MNTNMTYEKLYSDMVKKFTVEKDNKDYKLGEDMLMKAKSAKATAQHSLMPVSRADFSGTRAISAVFNYVSDKLTVRRHRCCWRGSHSMPLPRRR